MDRRKKLTITALSAGVAMVVLGASILAVFTSTATVGANDFTSGSITLTTSPTTALVTFSNMMPGDTVTNPITVTNGSSNQLRYAVSDTATNADSKALNAQLVLTIKTKDTDTSGCGNWNGTQLYTGALGAVSSTNLVGDPTQGSQAGDRTLNGSANEILCFRVNLPTATGNTFQSATTTATFTFTGEQTANNA